MGAGASSIPEAISKEQCQEIIGQAFTEELWLKHSKDGIISKGDLIQLATIKSTIVVTAVESSGVAGVVTFEQTFLSNPTKITYKFTGLKPGLHGFHINDSFDPKDPDKHFNPHGKNHGGPTDEDRHAGDLGNIEANEAGEAEGEMSSDLIMLSGEFSVMGHTLVICADPDDLGKGGNENSLINGNCGKIIARGDIIRTESQEPKQGSAMRNKFVTQASSKILRVKSEYVKRDEEDEDDPFKNQEEEEPLLEEV